MVQPFYGSSDVEKQGGICDCDAPVFERCLNVIQKSFKKETEGNIFYRLPCVSMKITNFATWKDL